VRGGAPGEEAIADPKDRDSRGRAGSVGAPSQHRAAKIARVTGCSPDTEEWIGEEIESHVERSTPSLDGGLTRRIVMGPRELVLAWVEAFNRADVAALAALYGENATNHQVAESPVVGRAAIRAMFESEFARAKMVCIIENVFEDGQWAILEWKDPLGLRGCGFFRVVGGLIECQRGYWDKLSFLRLHGLPIPETPRAAAKRRPESS
jgi:limonene-1,2-epoxide hydrolase